MDEKLKREMKMLELEKNKFQQELDISKNKMIEELKSINKTDMFKPIEKPKLSFFGKLKKILYGR